MEGTLEKPTDDEPISQEHNFSHEQTPNPSGWRLAIIITSLCLGTLLVAIDTSIIAVAIPKITTVFDSLDDVGWYGSAYLLSITALQPTVGTVYKYFDVKTTYLTSVIIFEGQIKCVLSNPHLMLTDCFF